MKAHFIFLMSIFFWALTSKSQVTLTMGGYSSVLANFKDTATEALKVASFILSTDEFRDSLIQYQLKCSNLPVGRWCQGSLPGQRVYDSLMKIPANTITINIIRRNRLRDAFDRSDNIGFSSYGINKITTRSWFLSSSASNWFISAKYAGHLAHEFSHIRGYYHINGQRHGEDVAATVGNLVVKIIQRRLRSGEAIK